jgi:hypothetical protein
MSEAMAARQPPSDRCPDGVRDPIAAEGEVPTPASGASRRKEAAVQRPSVVVVGGGFAGSFAAVTLERLLPAEAADLTLISATDHLCYSPLLPEVASGRLDPRRIAVPLHARLRRTRIVQATVEDVDLDQRALDVVADHGPIGPVHWDRLALTTGSVTGRCRPPGWPPTPWGSRRWSRRSTARPRSAAAGAGRQHPAALARLQALPAPAG